MDKILLESLVNKCLSTREIALETRTSQTNIRYWLKKLGLKTKINPRNLGGTWGKNKKIIEPCCQVCGETNPDNFYFRGSKRNKLKCKKCHNKGQTERFRENKRKVVEYKGGKCSMCGYNKCIASLDFHHIDPATKDSRWKVMKSWSFEKVKDELDKCILVCRNCHGEIHHKDYNI